MSKRIEKFVRPVLKGIEVVATDKGWVALYPKNTELLSECRGLYELLDSNDLLTEGDKAFRARLSGVELESDLGDGDDGSDGDNGSDGTLTPLEELDEGDLNKDNLKKYPAEQLVEFAKSLGVKGVTTKKAAVVAIVNILEG